MAGKPPPPGEDMRVGFRKDPTSPQPPQPKLVKINDKYYTISIYKVDLFGKRELISDKPELKTQVDELETLAKDKLAHLSKYGSIKLNLETGRVHYQESGHYFPADVEKDLALSLQTLGATISQNAPYSTTSTSPSSATPPEEQEAAPAPRPNQAPNKLSVGKYKTDHYQKPTKEAEPLLEWLDVVGEEYDIWETNADGNCLFDAIGIAYANQPKEKRKDIQAQILRSMKQFRPEDRIVIETKCPTYKDILASLQNDDFNVIMQQHREDLKQFLRLLAWAEESRMAQADPKKITDLEQDFKAEIDTGITERPTHLSEIRDGPPKGRKPTLPGEGWGTQLEINALTRVLMTPIEHLGYNFSTGQAFASDGLRALNVLRLLYIGNHYMAIEPKPEA